jgi:hypothetical protein
MSENLSLIDTPAAPASTKRHRIAAGVGLLLVAVDLVLCAVLALIDAYEGRGSAGPLIDAGFAMLYPAVFAGLFALFIPSAAMKDSVRGWFVKAQYALLVLAPLLILLDGDA